MKYYLKQVLLRGVIGSLIGLSIGYTVVLGLSLSQGSVELAGHVLLFNYLAAVIVGFYMAASSVVFDVEEWSLMKQTTVHSLLNLPYLIVAFKIKWVPETLVGQLLFVVFYFTLYSLIWLGSKIYWTRKLKKMNDDLKALKEMEA